MVFFEVMRTIFGIILTLLLGMLFWSNLNMENHLIEIRHEIDQLKREIHETIPQQQIVLEPVKYIEGQPLLHEDPFYTKTLLEILPKKFVPHGTMRTTVPRKPKDLHPFSGWVDAQEWTTLCTINLATGQFGKYEKLSPYGATQIIERVSEKTGEPEFWVYLRRDIFWEPISDIKGLEIAPQFKERHPVTARDYKFFFDALMNPYNEQSGAISLRNYYAGMLPIEIVDDYTFIVRWKTENGKIPYISRQWTAGLQPLAEFVYKYFPNGEKILREENNNSYLESALWGQNFNQHWAKHIIVSCGPWIFENVSDQEANFHRNPRFFSPLRALTSKKTIYIKSNPDADWQDFKVGSIDVSQLLPDQLTEWKKFKQLPQGVHAKRLDYIRPAYFFVGWNMSKPFFKDRRVRRAMTMAIDRKRIIDNVLEGLGVEISGNFTIGTSAYDASIQPWPYDPAKARELLRQAGWYDSDGDGVLDKDGTPFSFNLTYYVKNNTSKAVCEQIATGLKELQIDCRLNGVDLSDLSAALEEKDFDAVMSGWGGGTPPADPRQLWYSTGASQKGSSNIVNFSNKEADEIIDALQYESDQKKRTQLYHRFHAIIHSEAPYTFLFSPKVSLIYHDNVQNVFIPTDQPQLVPGAEVAQPQSQIFWLKGSF